MSEPFIGEIRLFAGNFAPLGWAFCQGQTLAIADNETLFNLIGTTYGGDGVQTFNLPNLSSRAPVHQGILPGGGPYIIGQLAGVEQVTLITQQLAAHNHIASCQSANGASGTPSNGFLGGSSTALYQGAPNANMNPAAISPIGGNLPHENRPPFVAVSFIISLFGIFPSQN